MMRLTTLSTICKIALCIAINSCASTAQPQNDLQPTSWEQEPSDDAPHMQPSDDAPHIQLIDLRKPYSPGGPPSSTKPADECGQARRDLITAQNNLKEVNELLQRFCNRGKEIPSGTQWVNCNTARNMPPIIQRGIDTLQAKVDTCNKGGSSVDFNEPTDPFSSIVNA